MPLVLVIIVELGWLWVSGLFVMDNHAVLSQGIQQRQIDLEALVLLRERNYRAAALLIVKLSASLTVRRYTQQTVHSLRAILRGKYQRGDLLLGTDSEGSGACVDFLVVGVPLCGATCHRLQKFGVGCLAVTVGRRALMTD